MTETEPVIKPGLVRLIFDRFRLTRLFYDCFDTVFDTVLRLTWVYAQLELMKKGVVSAMPHIGSGTPEGRDGMMMSAFDNAYQVLVQGIPPQSPINGFQSENTKQSLHCSVMPRGVSDRLRCVVSTARTPGQVPAECACAYSDCVRCEGDGAGGGGCPGERTQVRSSTALIFGSFATDWGLFYAATAGSRPNQGRRRRVYVYPGGWEAAGLCFLRVVQGECCMRR